MTKEKPRDANCIAERRGAEADTVRVRRGQALGRIGPILAGIINISAPSKLLLPFGGGTGRQSGTDGLDGRIPLEAMAERKMISLHRTWPSVAPGR